MTENGSEQPKFLQLDLNQWRRDIQTFANTTRQALEAISSEIFQSGGQQTSHDPSSPAPLSSVASGTPRTPRPSDGNPYRSPPRPQVGTDPNASDEDRLLRMKQQIEAKLAKSKGNSASGSRS